MAGFIEVARAEPRETLAFSNIVSWGEAGDSRNVLGERVLAGGYGARSVRVAATLTELIGATFASDARIFLTAPHSQGSLILQPFAIDAFEGSVNASVHVAAPETWLITAGPWRVRFYELVADSASGPDALWENLEITLDDEPLDPPATLAPVAGEYLEIEGNSSKLRANRVGGMRPGERLIGASTGGAAAVDGIESADYFRIATEPQPAGVYRHRLILGPGTHALSIRGVTQSQGFLAPGSDALLQSAVPSTQPPRTLQWYSFGQGERVILRVAGTPDATAPYSIAYQREPVVPGDLGRFQGEVVISTLGLTGIDTDLWLYDEQFRALPGGGNDDAPGSPGGQSRLARELAPGRYFLALSDFNLANHLASPADDGERDGPALDFEGALLNGSSASGVPLDFLIQDARGREVVMPATKPGPFGVLFYRFEVLPDCWADLTGIGSGGGADGLPDGAVTVDDLLYFLMAFEQGTARADLDNGQMQGDPDQAVTIDDLLYFVVRFEAGC